MKYLTLTFLFFLTFLIFAQNYSLSVFATPANFKIGNLNNQYNKVQNERIHIEHKKAITQEFGIQLIRKVEQKKFHYGLGASLKNYKYDYILYMDQYPQSFFSTKTIKNRMIDIKAIGVRCIAGMTIFPNTDLNFILELNKPYKKTSNIKNSNNFSYYSISYNQNGTLNKSDLTLREHEGASIMKAYNYIVPELNIQTKLIDNLSLYYGMKLKLWGLYDIYGVNIWGYYDISEESKPLYEANINSKQFTFYCGLVYNLNLTRKKNKVSSSYELEED